MYASEHVFRPRKPPAFLKSVAVDAKTQATDALQVDAVELAAIDEPVDPQSLSSLALVELLLKDRWRLYRLLGVPVASAVMLPRLLGIALAGYILFGVTISVVMTAAGTWPSLTSIAAWIDSPATAPLTFAP